MRNTTTTAARRTAIARHLIQVALQESPALRVHHHSVRRAKGASNNGANGHASLDISSAIVHRQLELVYRVHLVIHRPARVPQQRILMRLLWILCVCVWPHA
jgi:hypothetical protein